MQKRLSSSVEELRGEADSTVEETRSRQGFRASRRAPLWCRGPARVVGTEVVLEEEKADRYNMILPHDVVFDLAELAEVPNMIPTFVRRYGLLRHGAQDLGTNGCREPLEDWHYETNVLRRTLSLYHRLLEADETGSADPLRQKEFLWPAEFVEVATDADYVAEASVEVAYSIDAGLQECRLGIVSSLELNVTERGPTAFRFSHNAPNLLAAAYERLAQLVSSRAAVAECPGCGRMFVPQSGKQKYHSKTCASNSRWRRWKESQAE